MGERVTIYLEPQMRASAEAGQHNFIAKLETVLRGHGFEVVYEDESARHMHEGGRAIVHMKPPVGRGGLVIRRVYAYPFWAIERSEKRWEWAVARAEFDARHVRLQQARKFVLNQRKRLFGSLKPSKEGFVYVPLQGRIRERRSFQAASPLEMIETLLSVDTSRKVAIGLHPMEQYDAKDIAALERISQKFSRVSLVTGDMERLLPACDYVVSQNSAAAFFGLFFEKPCALFGKIDFHHIAAKAYELGAEEAVKRAAGPRPDFARYLWWFWQERSVNAGRPEAEEKIAVKLRDAGWI